MSDELLGIPLALLATIGWGTSAIFVRLGLQHVRTSAGLLVSMLAGILLVGVIAIPLHWEEIVALSLVAFGWFGVMGLINFVLGRQLNYHGLRLAGVARAMPVLSTAPLFATAISIAFLGETVNLLTLLGTGAIVTGIALVVSQRPTGS